MSNPFQPMSRERWTELMRTQADPTQAEFEQGYHYCCEWDGLLVGPDMYEYKFCNCLKVKPHMDVTEVLPEPELTSEDL